MYVCISIYVCMCIYIYIYVYIEREMYVGRRRLRARHAGDRRMWLADREENLAIISNSY